MKRLLVLLAAIALVSVFAATSMAAEWNFYGSARMGTYYEDRDENAGDDEGTTWDLQGNARIGAEVNKNIKNGIGGGFEFGVTSSIHKSGDDTSADNDNIYTRKIFGTYKFGSSQIMIGKNYSPTGDRFYSNQVWNGDEDLLSTGQFYAGRQPMIMFSSQGFSFALVKPNDGGDLEIVGGDVDITLPKVEAKFSINQDGLFADMWGGFQTYEIETPGKTYDVNSFAAGIGGGIDMDVAFLKLHGYFARNQGNYGAAFFGPDKSADDALYDPINDDVTDVDTFGGLAVLGFKASDTMTFEIGCGYVAHEADVDNAEKDETMSYYANVTINIAPGFFIVPEIGIVDYMENAAEVDQGKMTYYGAKWQIDF
ncbi:MAG: hypothetical protein GY749_35610 [Desulfobacteraceae bacterium]|nr:hypothetical protein [Desulfobacteraceae bacterium]